MNVSQMVTQRVPIPSGPSSVYSIDEDGIRFTRQTESYPSVFLFIHNPGFTFTDEYVACSVRADWVEGINEASGVCWTDETDQQGVLHDDDMEHMQHSLETVPNQWAIRDLSPSGKASKESKDGSASNSQSLR